MRRRIRSAAFPVHRHSLPQILVDGLLVALSYFLAFWLRFDGYPKALNARYDGLVFPTILWVAALTLVVLAGFGVYERLWNYVGQRDYEAVVKGIIVATLLVVGLITFLHPINYAPPEGNTIAVTLPSSVIALFLLLQLASLGGVRFAVHLFTEGRIRPFPVAKGARDILIVGGGDGGRLVVRELVRNPQLRMRPVGFVDDDPRKRGTKDEYGLRVARDDRRRGPGAGARRGRARRGRDRDPVSARDGARPGRHRLPPARHPRADDADGVRTAARRRGPAARHPPAPRGPGRGHARPRVGADGSRARRRLPRPARSCW